MRSWGWGPLGWVSVLIRRGRDGNALLCVHVKTQRDINKLGREPSPRTESASTLIWNSQALELWEINVCWLSHLVCGICYWSLNWLRHFTWRWGGIRSPGLGMGTCHLPNRQAPWFTGHPATLLIPFSWLAEAKSPLLAVVTESRKFGLEILKPVQFFDSKEFKFLSYDFFWLSETFTFLSPSISANQFQSNIKCRQFLLLLSFFFCFKFRIMDLFDQKKPQALFTLHGDMDNLTLIWGSIWAKIRQVATDSKSIRSRHVMSDVNQASEGRREGRLF